MVGESIGGGLERGDYVSEPVDDGYRQREQAAGDLGEDDERVDDLLSGVFVCEGQFRLLNVEEQTDCLLSAVVVIDAGQQKLYQEVPLVGVEHVELDAELVAPLPWLVVVMHRLQQAVQGCDKPVPHRREFFNIGRGVRLGAAGFAEGGLARRCG